MTLSALLVGLTVIVEPPLSSDEAEELTRACSRALTKSTCIVATDNDVGDDGGAEPVARVQAEEELRYRIVVKTEEEELSTILVFRDDDGALERARAMGLAIGLLGLNRKSPTNGKSPPKSSPGETTAPTESEPAASPTRSRAPTAETGKSTPQKMRAQMAFLGGFGLGAAYEPATNRAVLVESSLGLSFASMWLSFEARYVHIPLLGMPLRARALQGNARIAYDIRFGRFHQIPFAAVGAELIEFRSIASTTTATDTRYSPLIALGVHLGMRASAHLLVHVTPRIDAALSPTGVVVGEEQVLRMSPVRLGLSLGATYLSGKIP